MTEPTTEHKCEWCGEHATHCYREGRGTGHSEHVCACRKHRDDDKDVFVVPFYPHR